MCQSANMIDCELANDITNQDDNDSGFNSDEERTPDTNARRNRWESCLAELPRCERKRGTNEDYPVKEIQVWSPSNLLSDTKIRGYLEVAKEKYGFNAEQALALLYFNKHNIRQSNYDLKCYTPLSNQWKEDKKAFTEALTKVGKRFDLIRTKFFPHKSVKELVEYYYFWKMDRKKKRLKKPVQPTTH